MALAVLRKCVMSRITMGVTRKLKEAATCRKKPVYNAFDDWESPAQYEYLYYDDYVEEDLAARRSKFKYISPGIYEDHVTPRGEILFVGGGGYVGFSGPAASYYGLKPPY